MLFIAFHFLSFSFSRPFSFFVLLSLSISHPLLQPPRVMLPRSVVYVPVVVEYEAVERKRSQRGSSKRGGHTLLRTAFVIE
ncbi:hypothetical protein Fmac_008233 [Flemingia macrophylla]|uniref:Secreted protein n=1 Tax=Flemingia macrophylla TaxID=520843 RepID=A0ABD1MY13_9FABA